MNKHSTQNPQKIRLQAASNSKHNKEIHTSSTQSILNQLYTYTT